jgi:hypothetical protein
MSKVKENPQIDSQETEVQIIATVDPSIQEIIDSQEQTDSPYQLKRGAVQALVLTGVVSTAVAVALSQEVKDASADSQILPPTNYPTATSVPGAPTATSTPLPTNTPLPTVTNTPLPTATNTPLPTATATNTPSATPLPSSTPTASLTLPCNITPKILSRRLININ